MGDVQLGPVTRLTPADVQNLWIGNGGDPSKAWTAVAIVFSTENPAGNAGLVNDTPSTGDYSVGLWQINYAGPMMATRTAQFGSPQQMADDPNLQAKAAIALSQNGTNWQAWAVADFGYPDYAHPVTEPMPGSRVANWLAAHGVGPAPSFLATVRALPWPAIAGAGAILAAAGGIAWVLLTPESRVPEPFRRFALPNPVSEDVDDPHGHRDVEPMVVQSLLFPLEKYNVPTAQRWARTHGYKTGQVEVTPRYIHLVQMPARGFRVIRTIPMGKSGIKAHVARERAA